MMAASANVVLNDMSASWCAWARCSASGRIGHGCCTYARPCLPQFSYLCAANPSHQHQAPAAIPSRRTEPPDARLVHRCQKNRHASHRRGECEACAAERKHCDRELYHSAPEQRALAPINGVSANNGARVLPAVPLPARPAQWRAQRWLARAATAIRGFPGGACGPPDALCIRGRRAEPIGTFDACNPSLRHTTTTRRRLFR